MHYDFVAVMILRVAARFDCAVRLPRGRIGIAISRQGVGVIDGAIVKRR
jgi:hypothetical protein